MFMTFAFLLKTKCKLLFDKNARASSKLTF